MQSGAFLEQMTPGTGKKDDLLPTEDGWDTKTSVDKKELFITVFIIFSSNELLI